MVSNYQYNHTDKNTNNWGQSYLRQFTVYEKRY